MTTTDNAQKAINDALLAPFGDALEKRRAMLTAYRKAGLRLVECRSPGRLKGKDYKGKEAFKKGWPDLNPGPQDIAGTSNIGIHFENGLVDLDLDVPEARMLAPFFFPTAPAFGRESLPAGQFGHRVFRCLDGPKTRVPYQINKASKEWIAKTFGKEMICEYRTSTPKHAHQTVVPPSRYIGEDTPWDALLWERPFAYDSIPELAWEQVQKWLAFLALSTLALKCYPAEGGRDDYCMILSGAFLDRGMEPEMVDELVVHIATLAGDDEAEQRTKADRTAARKEEGAPTTGLPTLLAAMGCPELDKTVRRWFGENVRDRESKKEPKVEAPAGAINVNDLRHYRSAQVAAALCSREAPVWRRNSSVVTVRVLPGKQTIDGVVYDKDTPFIDEVTPEWIRYTCDEYDVTFCNWKGELERNPKLEIFKDVLVKPEQHGFHPIKAIGTTPSLHRNSPGYDPVSQRVLVFKHGAFSDIPMEPTKDEAVAALKLLEQPIREYRYGDEWSQSVHLSSLLLAVVRGELGPCPIIGYDAAQAASGKTKGASLGAILATGAEPAMVSWSTVDVENSKMLFAAFRRGAMAITIDNVRRGQEFDNDDLNAMLTNEVFEGRVLGLSEMGTVSTCALIQVTGNNLNFSGDLVTRAMKVVVAPGVSNPEDSTFSFDPVTYTRQHRSSLVVAALTVLRAYVAAGRPGESDLGGHRMPDFKLIRGALVWLGYPDPMNSMRSLRQESPELFRHARLIQGVLRTIGLGVSFKAWQLKGTDEIMDLLGPLPPGSDVVARIGWVLKKYEDKEIGNLILRSQPAKPAGKRYWIEGTDLGLWVDATVAAMPLTPF